MCSRLFSHTTLIISLKPGMNLRKKNKSGDNSLSGNVVYVRYEFNRLSSRCQESSQIFYLHLFIIAV